MTLGMKAIRSGDVDKLEGITVPLKQKASDMIARELTALFRKGQNSVEREAISAGMPTIRMASPLDPEDDRAVVGFLRSRAAMISSVLSERLRASLLRNGLDMIRRGEPDGKELGKTLRQLSDRDIRREVKLSTSESLNLGRQSFAKMNADFVREVVYSSVLDEGTCDPCTSADGETFGIDSGEADRLAVPLEACEGNSRCRCVHVYTFTTEDTPRG